MKFQYLLLLFGLTLVACEQEEYAFGDLTAPSNLQIEANVAGQTADTPDGDGSGMVTFVATADDAITYKFIFSDGTEEVAPSGRLTKRFTQVGVNTYLVTVVASGTAGIATTGSTEVTVESTFSDAEALALLTGDGTKTWYWAADEPGHLGVGQNDGDATANYFANYYQAAPFEKVGNTCMYEDELVFSRQGENLYYELNNFGATFFNVDFLGVAGGSGGEDACLPYEVQEDAQLVALSPSESVVAANGIPGQTRGTLLNFTEGGFMSYYVGNSTYEILSLTENRLVVRVVMGGNNALAWYHIFTSEKPVQGGGGGGTEEPEFNNLVWADEFDGNVLADTSWSYDTGTGNNGWGNNESQFYTDRPENVRVADGLLTITAQRENFSGSDFTSGRIVTQDKFEFTYGRIDIRAKLPSGGGTWPALWMLGANFDTVGWPACGEIDMMEHVGNEPERVLSALHFPGNSGGNAVTSSTTVETAETEFHVYTTIWTENTIRFLVDDEVYHTFDNNAGIPFNHDFFLIFNVAVGGTLGGAIDPAFSSSSMEVDYVRVYQ
ncbi:glycosyl hydrolase family 16 [Neolewinella xylanilytica]|uniref:Glycosyl hydrolase family 16 n=1 Tax=Neolewinella xylanilytica TaxID=1514080 RepID=A0A2S6I1M6_9BACT|nr:family 16 glycosylhydrolase [Neolewinella xylanilytica]PPK85060.1 glycosyl hydrolase family 16 [Neolewinella xylanilytica]